MNRFSLSLSLLFFMAISVCAEWRPGNYTWVSPSLNVSESMPCGGGDVGMNVWVEQGDILFYLSRSGSFDENNTLLKQGRFRLKLQPDLFLDAVDFRQQLRLNDGYVSISCNGVEVQLWADVFRPVVHVEVKSEKRVSAEIAYENWRVTDRVVQKKIEGQQCSYKWAVPKGTVTRRDSICAEMHQLTFFHRNEGETMFEVTMRQQGLTHLMDSLYNPLEQLTFGGRLSGGDLVYKGKRNGVYQSTPYVAWCYTSGVARRNHHFQVTLNTAQSSFEEWEEGLVQTEKSVELVKNRKQTRKWWNEFWNRSYIYLDDAGQLANPHGLDADDLSLVDPADSLAVAVRNYTLFRYMLGCNAYSKWPTKFNGGLFTFDPVWVNPDMAFTPDFRRWGGGTHTAQNQRLVYWPMLKNGDFDMMLPQFDYYLRILPTAEKRSRIYWNHEGACFAEQIENFGLPNPAEYGFKRPPAFDKGLEYNAWLEYEWDTVLEFCLMILETHRYRGMDIRSYEPLILSSLRFFDEHYRYLARQRGCKELDGNGKLVLFPGSACETYKMTYNASSTVAALHVVLQAAGSYFKENAEALAFVREMQQRIPSIPLHTIGNKIMISPALVWERVNNVETPQLYPVFPWRVYGLGRPNLEIARNTYYYDVDAQKFRTHIGWKQDNIWAACLGLTDEAVALNQRKLYNGPHRFPAFWGPGYDWTPDHNWGGSGMIGLQEMLMQEDAQGNIIRYPAWPKNRKVHFRLHASGGRVVME